ncbi:MAG: hypothetical protein NXY59_04790 [Aigarchaeota archaeon]|nr:hypothetical protein [Candidatus Pelearchaeum maunauluense]
MLNKRGRSLERRLDEVVAQLKIHNDKLSARTSYMSSRARSLFELSLRAKEEKDEERAMLYAKELSELKRVLYTMLRSQASLEGIILHLETVRDLNSVRKSVKPIHEVLSRVQEDVKGAVPEVAHELLKTHLILDDIMIEIGVSSDSSYSYTAVDHDAQEILNKASEIAAQRMKKIMPNVSNE